MECVVKPLLVEKVTGSKPAGTKNPTMLRVSANSFDHINKQTKQKKPMYLS